MARPRFISLSFMLAALAMPAVISACNGEIKVGNPEPAAPAAPDPVPAPTPAPAPDPVPAPAPVLKPVGAIKLEGNRVRIPQELEFDVDKATLNDTKDPNKMILNTLKDFMEQNKNVTKLRVEGHTDNSGKKDHNQTLSQQRAEAVAAWLGSHGVDKSRLTTVGYGDTRPEAPNDNDANKAKNRRTEFHVQDIDGKPVAPPVAAPMGVGAGAGPATGGGTPAGAPPMTSPNGPKK